MSTRESSPEIEIVDEIIQGKLLVEVVLPQTKQNLPQPRQNFAQRQNFPPQRQNFAQQPVFIRPSSAPVRPAWLIPSHSSVTKTVRPVNAPVTTPLCVYGRKSGNDDIARECTEDSINQPFQCGICDNLLCNNVSMMWHGFSHYLNEERDDEDLNDVSTCWICLRVLADPYRLMDHVDQVSDFR